MRNRESCAFLIHIIHPLSCLHHSDKIEKLQIIIPTATIHQNIEKRKAFTYTHKHLYKYIKFLSHGLLSYLFHTHISV